MNVEKLFPIFFAIWAVLGIGTTLFYAKAGVEAKRRWHPWLMIGAGALFLVFVFVMQMDLKTVLFAGPAVALITILDWKGTKFCPQCGRTSYAQFRPNLFCQSCGAALDGNASTRTDN